MMRFAADENFNNIIVRGLRLRLPQVDIVRVQDTELYTKPDPLVLGWAAQQNRILLSHDLDTIPGFVWARVSAALPMPGVILVDQDVPVGTAIEFLEIVIVAGKPQDFVDQILHIPF